MTTNVTGPNYRTDIQQSINQESSKTEKNTSTSTQTATIKGNATASSSAPAAEETQNYVPAYIDPAAAMEDPTADQPQLPLPGQQTASSVAGQPGPKSPDDIYENTLSTMLGQLESTNTSLARAVQFVIAHPNGNYTSGEFATAVKIAQQYREAALSQARTASGNSSYTAPATSTASADADLATQKENFFESIVQDNQKLTTAEKGQLLLAYNHPELLSKDALSEKLQQLLAKYTNAAQTMLENSGYVPKGYVPAQNSGSFDAKASYTFSEIFQQQAQQNGQTLKPPLSTQDLNYLLYTLNYPQGAKPPLPPGRTAQDMENLFNQTLADAKTAYAAQTGLPASYTPAIDTSYYDAKLLASFENSFEKQLASQIPPLTEEQKTLLRTALGQEPQNIPKDIQALFAIIKSSAIADVIKTFNLPSSWQPQTRNLNDPKIAQKKQAVASQANAVQAGQEMTSAVSIIADQMTSGPTKDTIQGYLRAVTDALQNISNALAAIMILDADTSTKMTKAQTDTNLDMIRIQQHEADKAWKKEQDAAKMNKILGAVMAIFMGPVGIALTVQKAQTGTNFFEKFMKNVKNDINSSNMPGFLKAILKALANYMFTIMACSLGGPLMALQQAQQGWSNSISDFAQVFGAKKDTADKIGTYISIALMLAAEIAIMIMTAGVGTSFLAGSFGSIMNMVSTAIRNAAETAISILKSTTTFITRTLPDLLKGASQAALRFLQKSETAAKEASLALRALEKATKVAKEAPNAANLARVEAAAAQYAEKVGHLQKSLQKLARQLDREDGFAAVAAQVRQQATRVGDAAADAEKLIGDIAKAAATRTQSGIDNEKFMRWFIQGFSYAMIGMTAITTGVGFGREMLLGQVAMIRAQMEASITQLRAIIKSIRAVINELIESLTSTADHVQKTQQQINGMFKLVQFVC